MKEEDNITIDKIIASRVNTAQTKIELNNLLLIIAILLFYIFIYI